MTTLILGSTGHVGPRVVSAPRARGDQVRALVRDPPRAAALLPAGIELAPGDLCDDGSARAAHAGDATDWEAGHVTEMLTLFRRGEPDYLTDHVQMLTGHPPRSVTDYLHNHAGLFATT